jgi:hypothetical protein
MIFFRARYQFSHPFTKIDKITVFLTVNFRNLVWNKKTKDSELNGRKVSPNLNSNELREGKIYLLVSFPNVLNLSHL